MSVKFIFKVGRDYRQLQRDPGLEFTGGQEWGISRNLWKEIQAKCANKFPGLGHSLTFSKATAAVQVCVTAVRPVLSACCLPAGQPVCGLASFSQPLFVTLGLQFLFFFPPPTNLGHIRQVSKRTTRGGGNEEDSLLPKLPPSINKSRFPFLGPAGVQAHER